MLESLSALALVVALGIGAEWIGYPSIVFLLTVGVLAGPGTGLIEPGALLGDTLFPVPSLAVTVILFEGGMNLRISERQSV